MSRLITPSSVHANVQKRQLFAFLTQIRTLNLEIILDWKVVEWHLREGF